MCTTYAEIFKVAALCTDTELQTPREIFGHARHLLCRHSIPLSEQRLLQRLLNFCGA
jgi:hypothetical protein